jgi:hypothetical protein
MSEDIRAEELRLLRVALSRLTTAIDGLRTDLKVTFHDMRVVREKIDVIEARTFPRLVTEEDTNGSGY